MSQTQKGNNLMQQLCNYTARQTQQLIPETAEHKQEKRNVNVLRIEVYAFNPGGLIYELPVRCWKFIVFV